MHCWRDKDSVHNDNMSKGDNNAASADESDNTTRQNQIRN